MSEEKIETSFTKLKPPPPPIIDDDLLIRSKKIPPINTHDSKSLHADIQKFTNLIICKEMPYVSQLTLTSINDELLQSISMKQDLLKKLNNKFVGNSGNINYVKEEKEETSFQEQEITNLNIQLIPDACTKLMKSSSVENLLYIITKKIESSIENGDLNMNTEDVYNFLKVASDYKFSGLTFTNDNQERIDNRLTKCIVQVWQVFEQFFKQFDYVDYLNNINAIENIDVSLITSVIRIFVQIGSINK